jgi:hypothetical protein
MDGPNNPAIRVTIVGTRAETLDGLRWYLSRVGLSARATRRLQDGDREPCAAMILFPDEFSFDDVERELHRLRRDSPELLLVLVTSELKRYAPIAKGAGRVPVLIPKPAWGWSILDAIRSAIQVGAAESTANE